jgi:hypothetical protein
MKKAFMLIVLTLTGCGGDVEINTVPEQPTVVSSPLPNNPSFNPVTNNTNTGSSLVETDILAQYMPNPYHRNMMPATVSLMGLDREDFLNLEVPPPPHEISPCYNAVMLSNTVPIMDPKYQYNGWWLLASLTNTKTLQIATQPQLYWATQLTDTEVGIVPTDVTIPGLNEKLKTDYGMFPYYYVNRLDYVSRFPVNPDEQCESLQR